MLYRHTLMLHRGVIEAAFVFESNHGDPYVGHDDDGTVRQVEADVAPFQDRIDTVNHAYPSPEREALYAEMWAATEAKLAADGHRVAASTIPPYHPPPNLLTRAQRETLREQLAFREKLIAIAAQAKAKAATEATPATTETEPAA